VTAERNGPGGRLQSRPDGADGSLAQGGEERVDGWRVADGTRKRFDLPRTQGEGACPRRREVRYATPSDLARLRVRRHPPMPEVFEHHLLMGQRGLDAPSASREFDRIRVGGGCLVVLGCSALPTVGPAAAVPAPGPHGRTSSCQGKAR
jgi:hypothetical protein